MRDIERLTNQFREAIDVVKDSGDFDKDFSFYKFLLGCCGDASILLVQFLFKNGIKTYCVCSTYRDSSFKNSHFHAWLLADNQTIIDITGDQFKNNPLFLNYDKPIYVGVADNFHRLFEVEDRNVHENLGLDTLDCMCQSRLKKLYRKIIKYIYKYI